MRASNFPSICSKITFPMRARRSLSYPSCHQIPCVLNRYNAQDPTQTTTRCRFCASEGASVRCINSAQITRQVIKDFFLAQKWELLEDRIALFDGPQTSYSGMPEQSADKVLMRITQTPAQHMHRKQTRLSVTTMRVVHFLQKDNISVPLFQKLSYETHTVAAKPRVKVANHNRMDLFSSSRPISLTSVQARNQRNSK